MTDQMAVKFVDGRRDLIEGMLAPFGGPIKGRDLHGEYFSAKTDFALDWFKDWERPLLWDHGLDGEVKTSVVGRMKVEQRDKGIWMQAQLEAANEYHDAVASLVDTGTMGLSSGSMSHLVQRDPKSGEIKRWPLIEGSLTPSPANPDARSYSIKTADAVAHLAVLGVQAPAALKGAGTADASTAAGCLSTLLYLLGEEADDPEQAAFVRSAIDALQKFITSESAEVGTPEDMADAGDMATMSFKSTDPYYSQAIHDAAVTSGAKCAHEPGEAPETEPAPVLAIKAGEGVVPVTDADLDEIRELLRPVAMKAAREVLRD